MNDIDPAPVQGSANAAAAIRDATVGPPLRVGYSIPREMVHNGCFGDEPEVAYVQSRQRLQAA
jgi:hypothetical protein